MEKSMTMLSFEYSGRATSINSEPVSEEIALGAAAMMNKSSPEIIGYLETKIKAYLPPTVNVQAQIEFRSGSLVWTGLILVLDWSGRLSAAVGLAQYLVRVINFTVNRIIRESSPENYTIDNPETDTSLVEEYADSRVVSQPTLIKRFAYLMVGNLTLSLVIIILLIVKYFKP